MRAVVTGQIGLDKKPYLESVASWRVLVGNGWNAFMSDR